MGYEFEGKTIDTDANGFLLDHNDWSEGLAKHIAELEGLELSDKHWDVMNYLREAYINEGGTQPNTRTIIKAMSDKWGEKLAQKDLYLLFPKDPSKQGARIAGLPESRRKGGY